jgi:hypothetical protein
LDEGWLQLAAARQAEVILLEDPQRLGVSQDAIRTLWYLPKGGTDIA